MGDTDALIKTLREELAESRSECERAKKETEEFVHLASHDLQEPLRKITTFAEKLQLTARSLEEGNRVYLDRIVTAAGNMRRLLDDLLDYSRAGRDPASPESVNLDELMQELSGTLRAKLLEAGAELTWNDLPVIEADPQRMRYIFRELLTNSIKFRRPDEALHISVSAEQADHAVRIYFRDNGIGFEPEYAERIFGIFQRLNGKSEYPGSGTGLAVCRKTILSMGGSISAEGKPGEGATITVILPEKR